MIDRPKRPARVFDITTYDFEWIPGTMQFRVAGVFDERGYRHYQRLTDFLDGELTADNYGRRYYAHFGGASDMVFLLSPMMLSHRNFEIKASFSSSSAIIVGVKEPRADPSRSWTFLDSFWTFRTKLENIGKKLGRNFHKGKVAWDAPLRELIEYNEQDCRILHEALTRMQTLILGAGGELGPTIASTSLRLIQRRFLKGPLYNSADVDEWCRPGYVASKSGPYRLECKEANDYDINSSFPTSMSAAPLPGRCITTRTKHLPRRLDDTSVLWAAKARVRVPEQYIPPLPYREPDTGRVFFPTGSFDTTICQEDFLCGGFEIEKIYSCKIFEPREDLIEFAETMYRLRLGSDPEGFDSEVWKNAANSGYGKWAERDEKQSLLVRPPKVKPEWGQFALAPNVYLIDEKVPVHHSHVPWAMWITARSRRYLREFELECLKQGEIYYSDCDAVFSQAEFPLSEFPHDHMHRGFRPLVGRALGEIKLEAKIKRGRFLGSKLYALELAEYKKPEDRYKVKAKGFSKRVSEAGQREPLTFDDFLKLESGEETTVTRMRRIKELLREASRVSGKERIDFSPEEISFGKKVHLDKIKPKRCPLPDGNTRPWNVEEIEQ